MEVERAQARRVPVGVPAACWRRCLWTWPWSPPSKTGRVSLRAFYYRRALRLFPALAVVLVAVALIVATGLMPENVRQLGTDYRVVFLGVLTYVSNWVAVAGWSLGVLGHTWSLAVEEQFYIIWPALLLIGTWKAEASERNSVPRGGPSAACPVIVS